MLPLTLPAAEHRPLRVLALGAHCDDIELGAGGTLLELCAARPVAVDWVVLTSTPERAAEAQAGARMVLGGAVACSVTVLGFRDGFLPYEGAAVKEAFEDLKRLPTPDLVLTHYRDDRHQDHRVVSDLTWSTFRDQLVLEYEIAKYDGDLGRPGCYVPVSEESARRKWRYLAESYPSQAGRQWFSEDTVRSLLRLRGVEAGSGTHFAEAFYARKLVLSPDLGTAGGAVER